MKRFILFITLIILCVFAIPDLASANQGAFFFDRGQQRLKEENYQGAIEDFTKSLYMMQGNIDTYFLRGSAKQKLGSYKGAIADYTKAIEIAEQKGSSRKALLYAYRGQMKQKLEDYKGAMADTLIAKDLYKEQKDFKMYKSVLANIKLLETQIADQKEIPVSSKQTQLSAKDYMKLAKADFKKRDFNSAIEKITKAIELDAENPAPYKARAMAKANLKNFEGAIEDLYKVQDLYEKQYNFDGYEQNLKLIEKMKKKVK